MLNDFFRWLVQMAVQEGAVVISPHPDQFHRVQRQYLDLVRTVPAFITNPPGVHPYDAALGHKGRWMFVWIPDKDK